MKLLFFDPLFFFKNIIFSLINFIVLHSLFWYIISYTLNKSFCWQETILKSEYLEIFVFAGLTAITLGLLGLSFNSLVSENNVSKEVPVDINSISDIQKPVLESPSLLVDCLDNTEVKIASVPILSKKEEVADNLFKFVRYELDSSKKLTSSAKILVDYVSEDRLKFILNEIETCKMIAKKYNMEYSRPGDDYELDAEKIYRRFQRYKEEEVSSFSHDNRFGDWFYASCMLDQHKKTLCLLMLALIEKPREWIDYNTDAPWDYETWKNYMFESRKNFDTSIDVLEYSEYLIQGYLHYPERYNKIDPVLEIIPNGPSVKVIYLWDEILKAEKIKKQLQEASSQESVIAPVLVKTCTATTLEKEEVLVSTKVLEGNELLNTSFSNLTLVYNNLKKILISFIW